ncbi:MAG: LCP family protein [Sporolactobacillus sp.]
MAKKERIDYSSGDKPRRRKHWILRIVLIVIGVLVVSGICFGAYKWYQWNPEHRFAHLKTIGGSAKTKDKKGQSAYTMKAGTFNVLLIGSDARPGDSAGHTDSMVLIHADLKNHTYNLLSIPRDTRVYMEGEGYTKLTSVQYVAQSKEGTKQGVIEAVKAISSLTGAPINFYAETDYWGLQDMVDAIGGIDMTLPFNVKLTHPWYPKNYGKVFTAGTHSLNGEMVTEICHERYSLPGTDYGRQQLQSAALVGIAQKMMQPSNITRFPALAGSLSKFLVATNMTTDDMISIGLSMKGNFNPSTQMKYKQVDGKDVNIYDDVLQANNDEIILPQQQLQATIAKYFTN